MSARAEPGHSVARTLATVLAAPLIAICMGAGAAAFLPFSEPVRVAVGVHSVVPLWACAMCFLPWLANGRRAWALCALICLPLLAALSWRALP